MYKIKLFLSQVFFTQIAEALAVPIITNIAVKKPLTQFMSSSWSVDPFFIFGSYGIVDVLNHITMIEHIDDSKIPIIRNCNVKCLKSNASAQCAPNITEKTRKTAKNW